MNKGNTRQYMNNKISAETQEQAMKVAKGTQKKGQTKEQTKLIAQGIEKGIVEYKKQQSKKLRERDKQRKKQVKNKQDTPVDRVATESKNSFISAATQQLPWYLLALSWLGFLIYINYFN